MGIRTEIEPEAVPVDEVAELVTALDETMATLSLLWQRRGADPAAAPPKNASGAGADAESDADAESGADADDGIGG